MKGFLRRLTGQKAETPDVPSPATPSLRDTGVDAAPAAQPASVPHQAVAATPAPVPASAGDVPGPVFSSRAVRDATVVTGAIDALGRFVAGQDVTGDLIHRLEALTADQVNFLQLSAEPGLIQRALVRTEGQKGTKAAALRKLLGDIAGGAIPDAGKFNPLLVPREPILPPLTSLKPKPVAAGPSAEPVVAVSSPVPSVAPVVPPLRPVSLAPPASPTVTAPAASVAAAIAAAPLPPRPRSTPVAPPVKEPEVKPAAEIPPTPVVEPVTLAPIITSSAAEAPPPVPTPPPVVAPADSAALPRLARADADSRRARLMAALNDHLSANEAAP